MCSVCEVLQYEMFTKFVDSFHPFTIAAGFAGSASVHTASSAPAAPMSPVPTPPAPPLQPPLAPNRSENSFEDVAVQGMFDTAYMYKRNGTGISHLFRCFFSHLEEILYLTGTTSIFKCVSNTLSAIDCQKYETGIYF